MKPPGTPPEVGHSCGVAMRLLLLAPRRAQTGNCTTARRIQDHLEATGHLCILKDSSDYESPLAVSNLISSEKFEAALGIHLFKAGRLLQGSTIPFGVVFGGTDINEDARSDEKARLMGMVLEEARFAVSFTEAMKEAAATYWPQLRNKICVQAQGIVTVPNRQHNWTEFLQRAGIVQDDQKLYIFLLICGLRRVKDPLYLLDVFSEWHQEDSRVHLIIIGPAADPPFAAEVEEKVNRADGVHLLPEVPQEDLHAVVKKCFAVVNTSISEGMSAAILEAHWAAIPGHLSRPTVALVNETGIGQMAFPPLGHLREIRPLYCQSQPDCLREIRQNKSDAMDLNVPVLARNIPGNAAVIVHQRTGLLYSTPQEFVQLAKTLMKDPFFHREIVREAREYVLKHHSWEKERKVYQNLVLSLR